MKKIGIIMMFVAAIAVSSCSSLTNVNNSVAMASGSSCAQALIGLRASQKAGTLSVANTADLSNMLVVLTAYNSLKANKDDANYKKSFAAGMVSGGRGIITNSNVNNIINVLVAASTLTGINSGNVSANSTTIVNALIPILTLLG